MKKLRIIPLSAALLFAAVSGSGVAEVRTAPTDKPERVVKSSGKARAPVTLEHRLGGVPVVGMPVELALGITAGDDKPVLLEISTDENLGVVRRERRQVRSGDSVSLVLVPRTEGRFYVNVVALMDVGARAYSIPVQVGKGQPATARKVSAETVGGERLVRMKAE